MKKRRIAWSLLVLLLLCGCAARKEPGEAFSIKFKLEIQNAVERLHLEYGADGDAWGSCCLSNADGSALPAGEILYNEFLPADFPEGADLTQFWLKIALSEGEKEKIPVEICLKLPVEYGRIYEVTLTGSAEEGYHAALNAQ